MLAGISPLILPTLRKIETRSIGAFTYERFLCDSLLLERVVKLSRYFLSPRSEGKERSVIYCLHGAVGDDAFATLIGLFESFSSADLDACLREGVEFVFPDCGTGYLRQDPTHPRESYADYFLNEVIPMIESDRSQPVRRRYLMGYSSGGYSALSLFVKYPNLFAGVVAGMPVLFDFDFFSDDCVKQYASDNGLDLAFITQGIQITRSVFKDYPDYLKHDPLTLLESADLSEIRGKPMFIDVGSDDEFGLWTGTRNLSRSLKEKQIPHLHVERAGVAHNMDCARLGTLDGFRIFFGIPAGEITHPPVLRSA